MGGLRKRHTCVCHEQQFLEVVYVLDGALIKIFVRTTDKRSDQSWESLAVQNSKLFICGCPFFLSGLLFSIHSHRISQQLLQLVGLCSSLKKSKFHLIVLHLLAFQALTVDQNHLKTKQSLFKFSYNAAASDWSNNGVKYTRWSRTPLKFGQKEHALLQCLPP